ncbi:MAG: dTMP kinase [bacterium]|nr:dTMP kinase [bacterium]
MKNHREKGLFIAFEGLDGSGSSTQVEMLRKRLVKEGYKTFITKEPTDNLVGGLIRGVLTKQWEMPPDGLQLLYAADRAHHLRFKIIPALEKNNIIISDRYAFSSIAFGALSVDFDWLEDIYKNYIYPDITFLVKSSPKTCIERIASTRLSFELFEEEEKLRKIWRNYAKLLKNPKNKMVEIGGEQPVEKVAEEIWRKMKKVLAGKSKSLAKIKD